MRPPTVPPNRVIREGTVDGDDQGERVPGWIVGLVGALGLAVGFVLGWFAAADFIGG